MNFNHKFINKPLSYFDLETYNNNRIVLDNYNEMYNEMKLKHPKFQYGWSSKFLSEHRFINRILYTFLVNAKNSSPDILFDDELFKNKFTVMDIGCYDGLLVKLLNDQGILTYGYEEHDWNEMYDFLNIRDKINVKNIKDIPQIDVVIMLNYAHQFHPKGLFKFVKQKCGSLPKYFIMDREERTPHYFNKYYYKQTILDEYNFKIITFNECFKVSVETKRELLISKNPS